MSNVLCISIVILAAVVRINSSLSKSNEFETSYVICVHKGNATADIFNLHFLI